jgi:hypothetical protein
MSRKIAYLVLCFIVFAMLAGCVQKASVKDEHDQQLKTSVGSWCREMAPGCPERCEQVFQSCASIADKLPAHLQQSYLEGCRQGAAKVDCAR